MVSVSVSEELVPSQIAELASGPNPQCRIWPLLRHSFKEFSLAKWALPNVTWTFLCSVPGGSGPMSCCRKEQWSCWKNHLYDTPQAAFQPDMKHISWGYAKGQCSVSAAIISAFHTVLTFSSVCLRDSLSWERGGQESISSSISLCSWWSSALVQRVLSTGSVQQSLNQPTGKAWAEEDPWGALIRRPRKETKPLVYGAGLRLRRCGRSTWVTDLHCWFSLTITLSVCTSFCALCSCCSCFLFLGYVCHGTLVTSLSMVVPSLV